LQCQTRFTRNDLVHVLFAGHIKWTIRRTFYKVSTRSNFYSVSYASFNCISVHSSIAFSYFSDVWRHGRSTIVVYHNVPSTCATEFRRSDMFARKQKNTMRIKFYIIY
jgi:hypothetical protein